MITRVPDRNSRSALARRDTVDALDERLDTPKEAPKFLSIGDEDPMFADPPRTLPKPTRKLHRSMSEPPEGIHMPSYWRGPEYMTPMVVASAHASSQSRLKPPDALHGTTTHSKTRFPEHPKPFIRACGLKLHEIKTPLSAWHLRDPARCRDNFETLVHCSEVRKAAREQIEMEKFRHQLVKRDELRQKMWIKREIARRWSLECGDFIAVKAREANLRQASLQHACEEPLRAAEPDPEREEDPYAPFPQEGIIFLPKHPKLKTLAKDSWAADQAPPRSSWERRDMYKRVQALSDETAQKSEVIGAMQKQSTEKTFIKTLKVSAKAGHAPQPQHFRGITPGLHAARPKAAAPAMAGLLMKS